ncbi:hypothetical protein XcodCFBP4690_04110 [Xanthomonas codiaei]|uniref:Uncharacterized protein n=1 Tax=Xanthomonas codiaei TaxID=56463 RepID=A0A2S7CVU8_9XANT|nr:hypothetical protein XcodCFBP4690_04110 [Xanthomonas codiaei]
MHSEPSAWHSAATPGARQTSITALCVYRRPRRTELGKRRFGQRFYHPHIGTRLRRSSRRSSNAHD